MREYKIDLPYPKVTGTAHCEDVAKLMDLYSGKAGECTAVLQYAYQSYIFKDENLEFSHELESIAVTEMFHHELLAEAIITFGADPVIAGRYSFFSGSYINYVKDFKKVLTADIVSEKCAIDSYQKLISYTDNQSLVALLSRIVMDEELHLKFFYDVLESFSRN